jgi:hypothetical protein
MFPYTSIKDVNPDEIEDISERFLPLFEESKDADTVKRIRLKDRAPLFVIAIVEHESEVNYRSSFKLLQYIALVLDDYEKEINKVKRNASRAKDFKFPPVLPIVFYDGPDKWTAETNFLNKTEMADIFGKYIPKFDYELIELNRYSESDLIQFGDILSLVMLIDKIQTPDEISLLSKLPQDYLRRLDSLNIPEHLKKMLTDVIAVLLTHINVPEEEIEQVTKTIYRRRLQEMFTLIKPYDVQETRRLEREKTEKEMGELVEAERERAQAKDLEAKAEREKAQAERERAEAREKEMREEMERLTRTKEEEIQEAVRKAVQAERERIQAGKSE